VSTPLTCREFVEFLDEYLDGALMPERAAAFDDHLAACPSCVAYMKTYAATIELAREAFAADEPVPGDVPEDLVRAILAAREPEPS